MDSVVEHIEESLLYWSSIEGQVERIILDEAKADADEVQPQNFLPCSRLIDHNKVTYAARRIGAKCVQFINVSPMTTHMVPWEVYLAEPLARDGIVSFAEKDEDSNLVHVFLLTESDGVHYVHAFRLRNEGINYVDSASFRLGVVSSVVAVSSTSLVCITDGKLKLLCLKSQSMEEIMSTQIPLLDRMRGKLSTQGDFLHATYCDGHLIACTRKGTLCVWNPCTRAVVSSLELGDEDFILRPNSIGPGLVAVASAKQLCIFDVPGLNPIGKSVPLQGTALQDVQFGKYTDILIHLWTPHGDGGTLGGNPQVCPPPPTGTGEGNQRRAGMGAEVAANIIRIDLGEEVRVCRPVTGPRAAMTWDEMGVEVAHFNSFLADHHDYATEEEIATQWWVDRITRRQRFAPSIILRAIRSFDHESRDDVHVEGRREENAEKRLKVEQRETLMNSVRGYFHRKGAARESWDLSTGDKTSAIHAICTGGQELLMECYRLQSSVDAHQIWSFSESWDTFVALKHTSISLIRPACQWEKAPASLEVYQNAKVNMDINELLAKGDDDPLWKLQVATWFFSRSSAAPWLTTCYSLLERGVIDLHCLSKVELGVKPELQERIQTCVTSISEDMIEELLEYIGKEDRDNIDRVVGIERAHNMNVSLLDMFIAAQFSSALEAKVAFMLCILAFLKEFPMLWNHDQVKQVKDAILCRLPRLAVCSLGYNLSTAYPRSFSHSVPDLFVGAHLMPPASTNTAFNYATFEPCLESMEFADLLVSVDAWDLIDAWCDKRIGLKSHFRACHALRKRDLEKAVDLFQRTDDEACRLLRVSVDVFSIPVPDPIVRRISYFIMTCDRLKELPAISEAYQFLEFAWEVWGTTDLEDIEFQTNLWQKAFIMARDHRLWDKALNAMLLLPREENQKWALRTLAEQLRRHGESERILSWNLPKYLFEHYIHDLERLAYPFPPLLDTSSLQCYNILYSTFVLTGEFSNAAKVMYKMYLSLAQHLQQMPIHEYIATRGRNHVPGDSVSNAYEIPGSADTDQSVHMTHESDKDIDTLKIQRDALLLCSQALELMTTPIIFMGGVPEGGPDLGWSSSAMDVDDGDSTKPKENKEPPSLNSLRHMLVKAKKRAKQVLVNPERIKLELMWTEAKIALRANDKVCNSTPEQMISTLSGVGVVFMGLALAEALNINKWDCVVKPFLSLCIRFEKNPKAMASITDAARGPNLSSMYVRNDGCEPLGCRKGHTKYVGASLWDSLREVCARTGHTVDVANELLTVQPNEPLPGFIIEALDNEWVTLLRLYMKHCDVESSLKILEKKLGLRCVQHEDALKTLCPTHLCRQLYSSMKQNHDSDGMRRLVTICEDYTFLSNMD